MSAPSSAPPPPEATTPPPPDTSTPPPPDSTSAPPPKATTPPPPDLTSAPPPPNSITPPPPALPPVEPPVVPPVVQPPVKPPIQPPVVQPPVKPPIQPPVVPPVEPPVVQPPVVQPPVSPPPKAPPPVPSDPPPISPPPQSPPSRSPPPAPSTPTPNASPPPPSEPSPSPPSDPSPPPPSDLSPPPPSDPSPPPPTNPSPSPPFVPSTPPPPETPFLSPPPQFLSPPPPYEPPQPPSMSSTPPSSVSTGLVVGIAAGSVVFVALLIGIIFLLYRKRRKDYDDEYNQYNRPPYPSPIVQTTVSQQPPDSSPSRSSRNSGGSGPRFGLDRTTTPKTPPSPTPLAFGGSALSYEDLQLATKGFSELNVLGQGGFGLVYQGTLYGKEVAIKKLKSGSGQGEKEFRAEVEIISRVHHRNLVTLVGYCTHEDQRLLVYEFVPNKTLDFHLHGSGRPTLDWLRRWKIALGAAKGLAYLHEDCYPKIIHRDIKAANILLDYNFEPKVADFGLAKFVPTNVTHVSTRIVGTIGYMAPDYFTSGRLAERADVYSYGVVLLELITGRKPLLYSEPDMNMSLVDWAKPLLARATTEENYDELIDQRLEHKYDPYDMKRLVHCAAAAVRNLAKLRPRMSQIVRYLEGEIALEDLNAGMTPGNSALKSSSSEQEVLRRMAFGGIISEDYAESDLTSDYEPTASSVANTEETEEHRFNRKSSGKV